MRVLQIGRGQERGDLKLFFLIASTGGGSVAEWLERRIWNP